MVEFQVVGFGLLDDPVKRFVSEAVGRVTAPDVAVDASEPRLLEFAGPTRRTGPQIGRKRFAALVEGG